MVLFFLAFSDSGAFVPSVGTFSLEGSARREMLALMSGEGSLQSCLGNLLLHLEAENLR